jgi:anti-sigma factor RsiW
MNSDEERNQAVGEHLNPLQLSIHVDGETPLAERETVAAHLAACATCAHRLESIRGVDATLARLARTTPSATVFAKTMAAARRMEQAPGGVARERLGGARRGVIRLRDVRFPDAEASPVAQASAVTPSRSRSRPRWRVPTGALATVAALLLVALTSALLMRAELQHGLVTTVSPTPVATLPPGQALAATQSAIKSAAAELPLTFPPVTPTYLPSGASMPVVMTQPLSDGTLALDIRWTVADSAVTILTLRELPENRFGDEFSSPQSLPHGVTLNWQVSSAIAWTPMAHVANAGWLGVEQRRSATALLLQAQVAPDSTPAQAAVILRYVSLAMDVPFLPLPNGPDGVSRPPTPDVLRTIATVQDAYGAAWTWDVTESNDQIYQDATFTNQKTGATIREINGPGGHGVVRDEQRKVYQTVSGPTNYQKRPSDLTQVAYDTSSLLKSGQLWNLGETTVQLGGNNAKASKVYDLYSVDTKLPEHVYVNAETGAVVAVWIDVGSKISPGGSASIAPYIDHDHCAPYTVNFEWLLYIPPTSFNTQPPQGWNPGNVTPPFTCSG